MNTTRSIITVTIQGLTNLVKKENIHKRLVECDSVCVHVCVLVCVCTERRAQAPRATTF